MNVLTLPSPALSWDEWEAQRPDRDRKRAEAVVRYLTSGRASGSHKRLHALFGVGFWSCCYCGAPTYCPCDFPRYGTHQDVATIEHKIPRSRGGLDAPENLDVACAHCNKSKGSRLHPSEWRIDEAP